MVIVTPGNIHKRIERLEAPRRQPFADIVALIEKHCLYDEITDRQRTRYCQYIGIPQAIFEEINMTVLGNTSVYLRRIEPPTPEELQVILEEQEIIIN